MDNNKIVCQRFCPEISVSNESFKSYAQLKNIKTFSSYTQSNMSYTKILSQKTDKSSRKRKYFEVGNDNAKSKKLCMEITINNNSKIPFDEPKPVITADLNNYCKSSHYRNFFPHSLIKLFYQLDLSVLCLYRQFKYKHKYPSLLLSFQESVIDKFNIIINYEMKSILIQVENVDRYMKNSIGYDRLFSQRDSFSVNSCFNNFVKYYFSASDVVLNNIEYLVIYTNSCLDLTEKNELKKQQLKNFYPFKFNSLNLQEYGIFKDFLITNNNIKESQFYQFLQDKTSSEEVLNRITFSSAVTKLLKEKMLFDGFENEIKQKFFAKLVFAVNQPSREELNNTIKKEIGKKFQHNLRKNILCDLTTAEKPKASIKFKHNIMYEFNLLMHFVNDMFLHKNIFSMNFEKNYNGIHNGINVHYKNKIMYLKVHNTTKKIGFSQLFPSKERKNIFSINKYFAFFVDELRDNIKFFIIYTNADLDLTAENMLKKEKSKDFYPLKFDNIDIQKKEYKMLKNCLCINKKKLYQFGQEEKSRQQILGLLKISSLQKGKGEILSYKNEKEQFLKKLVFATNQPNKDKLNSIVEHEIKKNKSEIPYRYIELIEILLRWSESYKFGPITKSVINKIFIEVKNHRLCCKEDQTNDINEEIKFAKSVTCTEGTQEFGLFLDFLVRGEGKAYLEVLRKHEINLSNVSSLLSHSGINASKAFKQLYFLWFDIKGNKTHYLKTLDKQEMKLSRMSSIIGGAGVNASESFKELHDLWFDLEGNMTHYLKTLAKKNINLSIFSCILNRTGAAASEAFKDLYEIWFDAAGNKTDYLNTLEKEKINLSRISCILSKTRTRAPETFKELYNLWFDEQGNKTKYLKTLEEKGINLSIISNILQGSRVNAPKTFTKLYDLWFDEKGNATLYLKSLEVNKINLHTISSFLSASGAKAHKAFKDLYNLWFDAQGEKTRYLTTLEKGEILLSNMSHILSAVRLKAHKAFKDLFDLWFDLNGNKTQYLKTLEKDGINISRVCSILHGTGNGACKVFIDLYNLWFDAEGNKTNYLRILEARGINLNDISSILKSTGINAPKAFKDLYDLWFDAKGNKSLYVKTLEKENVSLSSMSRILYKAGSKTVKAFKDLFDLWFDVEGNKMPYLETLENEGINLHIICGMLYRAGTKAAGAFLEFYYLWFDVDGNKTQYLKVLEEEGINLFHISCNLYGAGTKAPKAFKELYNMFFDQQGIKTSYLKHFLGEKTDLNSFTLHNLTCILSGAGSNVKDAFKRLHSICFNDEGIRTVLLNDFYGVNFLPSDLSHILNKTGLHAPSTLKKLHSVCFNKKSEKKQLLVDFFNAGFTPEDLCNILSGSADNLKTFHYFCFIGESKKYLHNMIREGFTPKHLCGILYGTETNIFSAFKDFHDFFVSKKWET